jgi:hypothetical protein
MSFNLASLIAGTSGTPNIVSGAQAPSQIQAKVKPSGEAKKKSFTHGVNVIFTNGTYKGYHGFVSDFFPASLSLMTSGRAFIESQKYGPLVNPGASIITEVGNSVVEQVIPSVGGEYVPIQLFKTRDDNQLRVGRVVTNENMIMRSLMNQGKGMQEIQMMMDNPNNNFVIELTLFDSSLVSNMSGLNIGGNEADILADQLTKMQINSETPAPLEQLSQEVKTNASLLDKIVHPEYFGDEVQVKVAFKRDLVGPQYYLNVSNNLGEIKIYNPTKSHYLVSYTRAIIFNPNMVNIQKEALQPGETAFQIKHEKFILGQKKEIKMTKQQIANQEQSRFRFFGTVKSGPYSGQRLEVMDYTPSHLAVTLSTNGRKITSHVVRKRTKDGNYIIDEFNNPVFETSMIVPTDVFYLDLLLKNGNYAQVNKILPNGNISVTEKDETRTYSQREVSQDEIQELQPGFKFSGKEKVDIQQEDIFVQGPTKESSELQEQTYDDDEDSDSQELDYSSSPVDEEVPEEEEYKASFKDTQRTTIEQRELTKQEKSVKDEIASILKLLRLNDESIDLYATMDTIMNIVKILTKKLKSINYTTDLSVTSNMKFIMVCIVLYELIKTGFDKNMNTVISILFPSYFSIKDIQAQSMNENIFLMKWDDNLSQERIDEAIAKIRDYRQRENDYPKIIQEIIINADIVLQGILGLHVNIMERAALNFGDLIPVGINPVTGRRFKDEEHEQALARGREANIRLRSQIVTVDDLLSDKPLPQTEVSVMWAKINEPIIEKFKQEVQKKADSQVALKQDYIYIKNNLYRAPFAIRDDIMKPTVRKAFDGIYKTLLATIIKQNVKAEKSLKRQRDEQEQVRINRARIAESKPVQDEDDEEIQHHTKSYVKEQQRRETKKALDRATRSANRNAYMMKKQRKETSDDQEEEKDAQDLINKVQNNEMWWNKMDTSE